MKSETERSVQNENGCPDAAAPDEEASALEQLQEQILKCRKCRESFGFEPRPVVWGSPCAKIVQISQAPGRLVHQSGKPFDDLSGKRLRNDWYHVDEETFYNPENFYFAMCGHCYPGKGSSGDRRPPAICFETWGAKEIALLQNARLYLIIGREAAEHFFPGKRLDELVFTRHTLFSRPCFVLPHPSARNRAWYRRFPEFERSQIPEIRKAIHDALSAENDAENEQSSDTKNRLNSQ